MGMIVNGVIPEGMAAAGVAQDGQPPVGADLESQLAAAMAQSEKANPDDPYATSSLFSAAASRRQSRKVDQPPEESLFDDGAAQAAKPKVDLVAMMNSGYTNVVDTPLFTSENVMDDD